MGGGATWTTGSYDVETQTLYWAVGNPYPDTDPDQREGLNLYTNSVLALDGATGKLKWYFQFTPQDTHDWDATEDCGIYRKTGRIWDKNPDPGDMGARYVRALNIETGDVVWEKLLTGPLLRKGLSAHRGKT
jgi:outer membrane protein assembly factor BamB